MGRSLLSWRNLNAIGAALSVGVWVIATVVDWIHSVAFVSHISMLALVVSFIAAWRADVPDKE